ncbi:MAG TPA: hypothetical protein VF207_09310, partial [Chthoniobacterales bacterium]
MRSRVLSSPDEGGFARLLARLSRFHRKRSRTSVIRLYCRSAKAFFNLESMSYWDITSPDEAVVRH